MAAVLVAVVAVVVMLTAVGMPMGMLAVDAAAAAASFAAFSTAFAASFSASFAARSSAALASSCSMSHQPPQPMHWWPAQQRLPSSSGFLSTLIGRKRAFGLSFLHACLWVVARIERHVSGN